MSTAEMDAPHATRHSNGNTNDNDSSDNDDALFAELEHEEPVSNYRSHRIEQLHAEFKSSHKDSTSSTTNTTTPDHINTPYPTITSDKLLLDLTTSTTRCIIHFAHPDFSRCRIMDDHLRELAQRHHEVSFARVDVRHTPFVVEKLNVRVLPYVIGFRDGVAVERVVGFEGLGKAPRGGAAPGLEGDDGFSTRKLEKRMLVKGVLVKARLADEDGTYPDSDEEEEEEVEEEDERRRRGGGGGRGIRSGIAGRRRGGTNGDDDDDDDWD